MTELSATPITGHTDPDPDNPWVMQIVVLVDKANPPTSTAVCEAAARAVAMYLCDPRTIGEWEDATQAWLAGRIRKHVRRATRPAAWSKVTELPGITVEHAGASVRVFPPTAMSSIPKDIARLQMSGTELEDPHAAGSIDPQTNGPLVISLNPHAQMPVGKAAAAAAHAAQVASYTMDPARLAVWVVTGWDVNVEHPDATRWDQLEPQAPVRIVDAGLTVVAAGTTTAIARWT